MKNKIQEAIATKNEESFYTELTNYVHDMIEGLDDYTVSQLLKEVKSQRQGKRGRIASPFTEVKQSEGTGKRGRPSLTAEEKLARLKEKFEKEQEAIREQTKYRELSQEEIDEINAKQA